MAELRFITIDCADHEALARFWAGALEWSVSYCESDGALIEAADGRLPRLFLQPVPEAKTVKNRVHVDLATERFDDELTRLTALGANALRENSGPARRSMVMADPEGNEFCLAESASMSP